jgi:UPF0755 protein
MRRLLLILAAIGLLAGGWTVYSGWYGPGPSQAAAKVRIADGATLRSASAALEKAGVIASASRFRSLAKFLGSADPIQAGEFAFPAGVSGAGVLDILQHGKPVLRLITIPEGTPSILVAQKLRDQPLLTGSVAVPPEGSVLPDSYGFESGEPRAAVLKRMQAAMTKTLATLWATRKPGLVVKTPAEAVILASIVEKETGKPAERAMVAGVYSNRLRMGMPLQADPTAIYPVTKGKPLGRRILQSELRAKNGYNTYASPGLPVGPIANPGRAAIAAVLDPAKTHALYFVADGTGGHVFANTLAEHDANVKKWFAIRRARGEM